MAESPSGRVRERAQAILLTRTFFSRLFESDLMPAGLPQVRMLINSVVGITVVLTMIPALVLRDRRFQFTLAMMALAFIALLLWEGLFPDRRDGRILSALPIRTRTFVAARLSALAALFGLFAVPSSIVPPIFFAALGSMFGQGVSPRGLLAHVGVMFAIEAFAFFSVVAMQCVLLNVARRAAAQRLAILLQVLLVIAFLQGPTLLPAATPVWLPTSWFLALYDVLAGRPRANASLAAIGAMASIGLPLLSVALYMTTYRRLLRRAVEGDSTAASPRSVPAIAVSAVTRLVALSIPNPVTRAVCFFTLRTIARSRRHKMLLAMYVGVATALVLSVVLPLAFQKGAAGFAAPDAGLLSTPLVLMFLSLVGLRAVIAIPTEIKANWTLRLVEPPHRSAIVAGAAAAMIAAAVAPITLLAFVVGSSLWGLAVGVKHAAFCGALGLLLAHALVLRLEKFPCACTYFPGASKMKFYWPLYLTLFSTYAYTMGRLQADLLRWGNSFVVPTSVVLVATAGLVILRRVRLRRSAGIRFEAEDPEAMFGGFQLSEALAAGQPRPTTYPAGRSDSAI